MKHSYSSWIVIFTLLTNSFLVFAQTDSNKTIIKDSVTKNINSQKIIEKYLKVIGGRKKLKTINDRTTYLTGFVKNLKIKMIIYQKAPDKYYQKIILGSTDQKTIFNGKEGFVVVGDDIVKISGDDLEKLKYESLMNLTSLLKVYNIKTKFIGERKVNNKNTYLVELDFPSGMKWKQFYDVNTFLKVKEIKSIIAPEDTVNQEIFFSDYKSVDEIKYPFEIKQNIGMQHFEFNVDSIEINTGLSNRNFELEE